MKPLCRALMALMGAVFVLTAAAGCKPQSLNSEEARELLSAVRQAREQVALKGQVSTNIRLADSQVQAEATVHRGAGRFQLQFITGSVEGVRIVEQDGGVWQIAADGKAVRHLPRNPVDQLPFMGREAVVEVSSGGQIAGRPTDKLVIRPRPEAVTRIEMWLDKANRFPLGLDRYNSEDLLIAGTRYTSVDFSAPPPPPVELPEAAEEVTAALHGQKADKAEVTEKLELSPVEPTYVPEGFAFQGYFLHERGRESAVELRYGDGVRTLSILQFTPRYRGEGRAPDGPGSGSIEMHEGMSGADGDRQRQVQSGRGDRVIGERVGRSDRVARGSDGGRRARRTRSEDSAGGREYRPDEPGRAGRWAIPRGQRDGGERPSRGRRVDGRDHDGVEARGDRREGRMMRSVLRGKIVRFQVDGLIVVVAGEISEDELNRVADSMRPAGTDL
ncbi:MAG: hypothetical protein GX358_03370 [candidate division WS1 bacterium]|nr:hypothetical protein [candidate division WS1 bacterium]